MSWFGKSAPYEPESDPPFPPRTASDEYLAGLRFIADVYEKRAQSAQSTVKDRANSIATATNYERLESDTAEIQRAGDRGRTAQGIANEIRDWIRDFEFRGARPPHLPPLPPSTTPESTGELTAPDRMPGILQGQSQMKLLRLCAAVALLCAAVASPVHASFEDRWQVAQAAPSGPVTQNTVQTTGPVSSETTISVGTVASQALAWVVTVFGAVLGTAGTALLFRMFRVAGLQIGDLARARLQEFVINGLNFGAKALENEMAGRGKIEIKNAVVAEAVNYVQDHGAETLKQLGIDPNSNMAVDAIKARIETAIADPMQPTPATLDPTPAKT